MEYDVLVFAGRFAPFTLAHQHVVSEALKRANSVILLVGSSETPRSVRNPWTFDERKEMIIKSMSYNPTIGLAQITILPIPDYDYADHLWVKHVLAIVKMTAKRDAKIGLIGHNKDSSSFYLTLFPEWGCVDIPNYKNINATDVRKIIFSSDNLTYWENLKDLVPPGTYSYLTATWRGKHYATQVQNEYDFCVNYKKEWGVGPFLTADSVVMQAGHVLMVERADHPGKGLLALPGGFMNPGETLKDASVRELDEETGLDMPRGAIEGSHVTSKLFDAPHRDPRARIITEAHLYNLDHELVRKFSNARTADGSPIGLTKVTAGSDAKAANWIELSSLRSSQCFADHYHIVQKMLGYL